MAVTPPEMLEVFGLFFQYGKERVDVGMIGGMYESLVEMVKDSKVKKVSLKVRIEELPYDIRVYVDTINIFYDLSSRYAPANFPQT